MSTPAPTMRRTELLDRCRRERNAFIASAARKLDALPRARDALRLLRTLRRIAELVQRAAP